MPTQNIKPPLKFYGGKTPLASKFHKLAPQHLHRVHAYGGGLGELWNWPYEDVSEVVNDINLWLTNFFRVLQDETLFEVFHRKVQSIPFSEVEWDYHSQKCGHLPLTEIDHNASATANVEIAVSFFVMCRQSYSGECKSFAPLSRARLRRKMNEQASAWLTTIDGLPDVHTRLMQVVIKNKPALELIQKEDTPHTLFYLDPPYHPDVRTALGIYGDGEHEMTAEQHEDLMKVLTGDVFVPKGKFMLSGYDHELYNDYLAGWSKVEFNRANSAARSKSKRRMIECVWMNYPVVNVRDNYYATI